MPRGVVACSVFFRGHPHACIHIIQCALSHRRMPRPHADGCIRRRARQPVFCPSGRRLPPVEDSGPPSPRSNPSKADQFHLRHGSGVGCRSSSQPTTWRSAPRAPSRRTLFGSMSHLGCFAKRCVKPTGQRARRIGATAQDSDRPHRTPMGAGAGRPAPWPLLDHWRMPVLELLQSRDIADAPSRSLLGPLRRPSAALTFRADHGAGRKRDPATAPLAVSQVELASGKKPLRRVPDAFTHGHVRRACPAFHPTSSQRFPMALMLRALRALIKTATSRQTNHVGKEP